MLKCPIAPYLEEGRMLADVFGVGEQVIYTAGLQFGARQAVGCTQELRGGGDGGGGEGDTRVRRTESQMPHRGV